MKAAPLTSGLLARKGEARPAMQPTTTNQVPSFLPADIINPSENKGKKRYFTNFTLAEAQTKTKAAKQNHPHAKKAACKDKDKNKKRRTERKTESGGTPSGRVHTSLRLDEDIHLRLRLFGAQHHESLQTIMVKALSRYLDTEMGDGLCVCGGPLK